MAQENPGSAVLVVGSYAPVRTPGAAATLDQVRRIVAAGGDAIVSSPRASAAHYEVGVTGVFAVRRLANLQRLTGAGHVIICAERDLPLPTHAAVPALLPLVQRATLQSLRRGLAGFARVTIVVADDLGVPPGIESGLLSLAVDVKDEREQYRDKGDPGVTVLGPDERTPAEKALDLGVKVTRQALGPAYPPLRRLLRRLRP